MPSNDQSLPMSFRCPSCGASLPIPETEAVTCTYCGASVIVPPELRPEKPDIIVIQQPSQEKANPLVTAVFLVIFFTILTTGIIFVSNRIASQNHVVFEQNFVYQSDQTRQLLQQEFSSPRQMPSPTPANYRILLTFGSSGEEVGQLDDSRYIAVGQDGRIYTADYSSGRVQIFDADGNFERLIHIQAEDSDDNVLIFGLGISSQNEVLIQAEGGIHRYASVDGLYISTIPNAWPNIYFQGLVVTDQTLYSGNGMAGTDDIIELSIDGTILNHYHEVIQSIEDDDPALDLDMAVAPNGNIFLLSSFGAQVYVYSSDGTFLKRFGQSGDSPGNLNLGSDAIATDRAGNVYIASSYRIDRYDAEGNFSGDSIDLPFSVTGGVIRDMAVDSAENLYLVTSGGKILKVHFRSPGS